MNTATNKGHNLPVIEKLFADLAKHEKALEGIGRDIVMDIFNNAATYNLDLLAVGNATDINTEARKNWMVKTIPAHAADIAALDALKKPGTKSSIEVRHAYEADRDTITERIEARRSMVNRAVPTAFYMFSRNATGIHFTGSKKNKVLFTFLADAVDTAITAPVIDKDGKPIPVARINETYSMTALKGNGEVAIAAHIAKRTAVNPSAVKVAPARKKAAAVAPAKSDEKKPTLETVAELETAASMSRYFQDTTGDKLIEAGKAEANEILLCNMVRARFGKFDPTRRQLKSIDIGEMFTWLRTQNLFQGVVWTGHATTAEVIRKPTAVAPAKVPAAKVSSK